jgi:hypothetical protein
MTMRPIIFELDSTSGSRHRRVAKPASCVLIAPVRIIHALVENMPPKSTSMFFGLRSDAEGIRGSFEEFCCQLFRRAPEVPAKSRFRRIRGAGGDAGVEATWTVPDGKNWGLQAKFFDKLAASEKAQVTKSIMQAAANYPALVRYTICLPFNLTGKTGAKTGKPKRGQHETFLSWTDEWKAELAAQGRIVEFDLWDESELLGRLAEADPTGGLAHFWFNGEVLSDAWFEQRWKEAKAQAGPRYSPELRVETPLDDALQAFGRSELWIKKVESLRDRFSAKLDWWRRTTNQGGERFTPLPAALVSDGRALLAEVEPLENVLDLATENPGVLTSTSFKNAVRSSIGRAAALEPILRDALLKEHGPHADTPGFRQFRAEYEVDFPMAPLDHLRELRSVLREVELLAFQPDGQLPAATAMLLRGEAGIGKTHGIIDAAAIRGRRGLRSIVLFGEDITGPEPWTPIIAKLGFGAALGRDAMLVALDAAGEASGFPLVIFIDALNETLPDRRRWQAWLPAMLEQIKPHASLKLCVSCRDTYVREVVPPSLQLPTIVHNGFLGQEYEAQFAFFQHYGLGVPAEPLLQDEFANPLFLRLVCEALCDAGTQAVPVGREGIRSIINLLLAAKNHKAAAACDYDPRDNRVSAAMLRIAAAMAEASTAQLPLSKARGLVDRSPAAQSRSLFAVLEAESLIAVVERPPASLGGEPDYSVRFTFERIGDHLIAEHLLSGVHDVTQVFAAGGRLHFLCKSEESAERNAGLLEALSIRLPETYGAELIDVVDGIAPALLLEPLIGGLPWRNPAYVSNRTRQLVREALSNRDTAARAFEAILGLAARPDHPLNARFLNRLLGATPMLTRDPFWANMMEKSYSGWSDRVDPHSGVHRLIDTARRADLSALPDDVGELWGVVLAWFCASPDRRIRDRATMAMVSLFRARPTVLVLLLRRFAESDDEYIAERVLVASYGAFLLNPSKPHLREAASEIFDRYFADGEPPLNASLRDHARLIIELAVELNIPPSQLRPDRYRPPYSSPWPIQLPTVEEVKPFAEDRQSFPQMSLVEQFGFATGTDFARYIVQPRVVNSFEVEDAGLPTLGLFRWFLKRAVELGYPGPKGHSALFDRNLLATFGGGRGKPAWAERLGKKYYWIFLYQLVGQVADHVPRKHWSPRKCRAVTNDLQALDLRDIDPTDVRMFSRDLPEDESWLSPCPYVFTEPDAPEDDAAWVAKSDLPNIEGALILTDNEGDRWHALDMPATWNGKRANRKVTTYRHVSRGVSTATCSIADIEKVKRSFSKGLLDFDHDPHDYRGYLGEYPQRWPYRSRMNDDVTFGFKSGGIDFSHISLRQLRGGEWERDYSQDGRSPSLLMPSPDLVKAGDLHWDGRGSWFDGQGMTQVIDPWWWSDLGSGLIVRLDYLDHFLEAQCNALAILGFQIKFIAGTSAGPGRLIERTLFVRSRGRTELVKRKVTRD